MPLSSITCRRAFGIEGAPVDPVLTLVHRIEEGDPVAVPVDHAAAAGEAERGPVDDPGGLAFDLLDVGNAVLELRRRPRRPHVVGLGEVRVGVDDPNAVVCQRGHNASTPSVQGSMDGQSDGRSRE